VLEVRGLDVSYGRSQALWGVDLDVGNEEIVAVVGPNGAGKTTLVSAAMGLLPAHGGRIVVDGRDMTHLPPHRFPDAGLALVPEGRRVFSTMSVEENLAVGGYRRANRGASHRRRSRVYELFPRLEQRRTQLAGTLSGGEQQMVAIGRALMSNPRVLLLDEPSMGLAPVLVDRIFDALLEINRRGVAILLVEQDVLRAFDSAHRGYVLSEGRIVRSGPPDVLRSDEEVRRICLGV
jgi:branched-chain amino acid transport system ATP-binding protein